MHLRSDGRCEQEGRRGEYVCAQRGATDTSSRPRLLSLSPFPEGSLTRQVAVRTTQANVRETATDGEEGRRRRARADLTRLIMISSPPNKPLAGFDLI